jgi:photosystem II stability/assembly factor-like uncharacterized protein
MLVAGASHGLVYTSADAGTTWVSHTVNALKPYPIWVGCSADGNRLVAAATFAPICTSADAGTTWTPASAPTNLFWYCVASSADGTKLAAGSYGSLYTSTNSGATWAASCLPPPDYPVYPCALSPYANYVSIAQSADGRNLVALGNSAAPLNGGLLYVSTNSGTTWAQASAPADGTRLIAAAGKAWNVPTSHGGVYTAQSTPKPQLGIVSSGDNVVLSWLVPSMNFGLRQNSDLSTANWSNVNNPPMLNLTTLQNEVVLPLPASNAFYRLNMP